MKFLGFKFQSMGEMQCGIFSMNIKVIRKSFLFILFLAAIQTLLPAGDNEEFEKGKVIDKVVCKGNASKSYALYVPTSYTSEEEWPVLFAFDPGARGRIPVEIFRDAAEKYNYIVVGSNDARNGPWEPVIQAMTAVWKDTDQRFSLNKKRIYVTGFSGGSRAASIFSRITALPVAGIIGCAAGIANSIIKPEDISPAYYFGVVGITDFNFREMIHLHDQFDQKYIDNRLLIHERGHDWPDADICHRVLGWMDVIGMKKNVRTVDESLISELYQKEKAEAESLETSGELIQALSVYEDLEKVFSDWIDMSSLRSKIGIIKGSKEYKKEVQQANKIKEEEALFLQKFYQFYAHVERNPLPLSDLGRYIDSLKIDELVKKTDRGRSKNEKAAAVRLLQGLEFETSNRGRSQFQAEEFEKAIYFYETAAMAGNEDSQWKRYMHYNLACAYARLKKRRQALENLDLAVKYGFDDTDYIAQDEDLDFIRESKGFQKIILVPQQRKKQSEKQRVLYSSSVNFPLEIQYCNI
jgi:tetratricopeptide (TPR) repeat protein